MIQAICVNSGAVSKRRLPFYIAEKGAFWAERTPLSGELNNSAVSDAVRGCHTVKSFAFRLQKEIGCAIISYGR